MWTIVCALVNPVLCIRSRIELHSVGKQARWHQFEVEQVQSRLGDEMISGRNQQELAGIPLRANQESCQKFLEK